MKLEAKNRLEATGTELEVNAATAKEAAVYIQSVFKKHNLDFKVKGVDGGGNGGATGYISCVQKTPYGEINIGLDLAIAPSGKTSVDVDFLSDDGLAIRGLLSAKTPLTKMGKKGIREFSKFAKDYAKQANEIFEQAKFAEEWIRNFAAALVELNAAMAANKTKVAKK